jgi:TrmH family RNA methyltransferase
MELSQRRTLLLGRLRTRKTRLREGLVSVEGVRAVTEALDAAAVLSFSVLSPRLSGTDAGAALAVRLRHFDATEVLDRALDELSDTDHAQGVISVFQEPVHTLAEIPSAGRILILDAIQDPGNVGTLVRSAVAFGLDAVLSLDGTVDPWGSKAVRASAGMMFRLPIVPCRAGEVVDALSRLGIPILVAAAHAEALVVDRPAAFGLVVGNEGAGVRDELRASGGAVVSVRMSGPAESLNVGIAGSILMHELAQGDR